MTAHYDLLVIDLDGTLLDPGGAVSARNRDAVEQARAAGLEVVIATGRTMSESRRFLEAIGHEGMLIAAGGALLFDTATGRTIARTAIPMDVVTRITALFVEHGHKALILKDSSVAGYDYLAVGPHDMNPASLWWFESQPIELRFAGDPGEDLHPHDTVRAGIVSGEDDARAVAGQIAAILGERVSFMHWSAVTSVHATGAPIHVLEVFHERVNKWTMVESICAQQGLDTARVAAIGDGLNDVELVREAGLGVAMGNADERVGAVADRVTADHASDGVALAVERILEGTW